jgi:hypothetical protein
MRWLKYFLLCTLMISAAAYARQITGKTNKGSFNPILQLSTELSFPSGRDTIRAGEQGTIKIAITNSGGSSALGVIAKITPGTIPSGVNISADVNIGTVTPGSSRSGTGQIEVQKSAVSQQVILSVLAATASGIKSQPQSISFFVREAERAPTISAYAKFTDPSGNGFLEGGETGTLTVGLVNSSETTARGVFAKLVNPSNSKSLTISTMADTVEIPPRETKTVVFQVTASDNVSAQTIAMKLEVSTANCVPIDPKIITITTKERVFVKDVTPPDIELLEPVHSVMRGMKNAPESPLATTESSSITIKGVAKDSSGVAVVLVHGEDVRLTPTAEGAEFSTEVLLAMGLNNIEIKAVDRFRNEARLLLTVRRTQPMVSGNFHALIIAVQDYSDSSIPSLQNPIQDAQTLIATLNTYYKFDRKNITLLKNPTRNTVIQTFDQLAKKLTKDDNLLIFYAGHGYWDDQMRQGFWLPADAHQSSRSEWISNGTIRDYVAGVPARHTLLISDACFSGGIFKTRDAFSDAKPAIRELYKLPSRKAMTSGMMKAVPDKSVFVEYLIKRLKDNTEQLLTAEMLFTSFRQAVINNSPNSQIPQYGEIRETGDEGGDFIFVRR